MRAGFPTHPLITRATLISCIICRKEKRKRNKITSERKLAPSAWVFRSVLLYRIVIGCDVFCSDVGSGKRAVLEI